MGRVVLPVLYFQIPNSWLTVFFLAEKGVGDDFNIHPDFLPPSALAEARAEDGGITRE